MVEVVLLMAVWLAALLFVIFFALSARSDATRMPHAIFAIAIMDSPASQMGGWFFVPLLINLCRDQQGRLQLMKRPGTLTTPEGIVETVEVVAICKYRSDTPRKSA